MIDVDVRKTLRGRGGCFSLDLRFSISGDAIAAVTGPSGGGKTSLLRMIAGFLAPDEGEIRINGKVLFDSRAKVNLRSGRRGIGYVFQDYALFPNMTVTENIAFAGIAKAEVPRLLSMAEMTSAARLYPHQLSGGQQQRVALLRAIARNPEILLLDEPLSAVDPDLRGILQDELVGIFDRFRIPMLIVTHDYGEIERLSHHIIRIDMGRVTSSGSPEEVLPRIRNGREVRASVVPI